MLNIQVFNQRDPKWGGDKHGTSNSTMAKTGCTVSILASMLVHAGYKTDPGKLNKLLTDNNGYRNGNLVFWPAISQLFPKVKWVYRHYTYDNALASEWIKQKGIMPIIEVGAAPIGGAPGGKHWVGFVGDMKSADPWTGTIRDTSTWQPTGMALYEYTPAGGEGDMPPLDDTIIGKATQRDEVVNHFKYEIGTAVPGDLLEKVKATITASEKSAVNRGKAETLADITRELGLPNDINSVTGLVSAVKTLIERASNEQGQNGTPIPTLPTSDKLQANGLVIEWEQDGKKYKLNHIVKE